MKKQQGFTLIELVMVIVILGVLSATALPKFVSLQQDAKIASLKGMKASLQTAVQIAHAKALIQGANPAGDSWVDMNNNGIKTLADGDVYVRFLYPSHNDNGLQNLIELDGFTRVDNQFRLTSNIANCAVFYRHPNSQGDSPTFTIVSSAC